MTNLEVATPAIVPASTVTTTQPSPALAPAGVGVRHRAWASAGVHHRQSAVRSTGEPLPPLRSPALPGLADTGVFAAGRSDHHHRAAHRRAQRPEHGSGRQAAGRYPRTGRLPGATRNTHADQSPSLHVRPLDPEKTRHDRRQCPSATRRRPIAHVLHLNLYPSTQPSSHPRSKP
jgi:hypothetical protein